MLLFPKSKLLVLDALRARAQTDYLKERERERAAFLSAYSPEILGLLRGEALLHKVGGEASGSKSGLFYELEFGDTYSLGSISGGSALKFELYRGADGEWKKRLPGNLPGNCSLEEAVSRVEHLIHEILLVAVRESRKLEEGPTSRALWENFAQACGALKMGGSSIPERGWAHKYLSIVAPELFSFHHSQQQLQNHYLLLGILPESNRWLLDWQWNELHRLDSEFSQYSPVLLGRAFYDAFRSSVPGYWRVGTTIDDQDCWPSMQAEGFVAIGWPKLGNLAEVLQGLQDKEARQKLSGLLVERYGKEAAAAGNTAGQIFRFARVMQPGDRVVAMRGASVLGVGIVASDYSYGPDSLEQPHSRKVTWAQGVPPQFGQQVGLRTTVFQLGTKQMKECLEMEAAVQELIEEQPAPVVRTMSATEERILSILERKGQVILFGPPGTGKTYHARKFAQDYLAGRIFRSDWPNLSPAERQECEQTITFCTFHPAYGYEEFLEGYRPKLTASGQAAFEIESGIFRRVCRAAQDRPDRQHFLIIDEINRGNIPTILGECITLIEKDKRGKLSVTLPYSKESFSVPENVWLIGTMNTADRSISLLDTALRRRFGFVELMPEPNRLGRIDDLPLSSLLSEINRRVLRHVGRNARDLQIGHAYLMNVQTSSDLCRCIQDEVVPLLKEYCYENTRAVGDILGSAFLDGEGDICDKVLTDPERCFQALRRLIPAESGERLVEALDEVSEALE